MFIRVYFFDWRYGKSCYNFDPALWTVAPLTLSLVQLSPSGPQTNKHLPQSPHTGQFFRWRHIALPSMSQKWEIRCKRRERRRLQDEQIAMQQSLQSATGSDQQNLKGIACLMEEKKLLFPTGLKFGRIISLRPKIHISNHKGSLRKNSFSRPSQKLGLLCILAGLIHCDKWNMRCEQLGSTYTVTYTQ